MHDVKKVRLAELTEKEKRFNEEKIEKFKALYDACFAHKESRTYTRQVLEEDLNRLNEVNPENTSMWNYRRDLLMNVWKEEKVQAGKMMASTPAKMQDKDEEGNASLPDHVELFKAQVGRDLKFELELNTTIIKKDAKCYAAFVHRQWIIGQIPVAKRIEVLEMEKAQLEKLLKADERNFHAWGYRRWVTTQLMGAKGDEIGDLDESEMKFSATKIGNNMSNYSAWHNRALIFQRQYDELGQGLLGGKNSNPARQEEALVEGLQKEMELLVQAFYCDSKDQSAWIYAQWVMETLLKTNPACHRKKATELLASCAELIEAEEEDLAEAGGAETTAGDVTPGFEGQVLSLKWPLWFSVVLHRQLEKSCQDGGNEEKQIQKLLSRLCEVDSARALCFRATLGKSQ